jgi:coenzyme PQQ precursor peptide PqqA
VARGLAAFFLVLDLNRRHLADMSFCGHIELKSEESFMVWKTPTLVEICIGLEING